MSIHSDNIVAFDPSTRRVQEEMRRTDYVNRKLDELMETTGTMEMDDTTSRQIVKFQSRLIIQQMFEKVQATLNSITPEEIAASSIKERVTLTVGLTGRIDTLMTLTEKITQSDGSDMDQFIAKLRTMERAEAIKYLRKEFVAVMGALFTDDEREQLFENIEEQVDLDKLGIHDDNVRGATDGQASGSARWVPKRGPTGVLPPPS